MMIQMHGSIARLDSVPYPIGGAPGGRRRHVVAQIIIGKYLIPGVDFFSNYWQNVALMCK